MVEALFNQPNYVAAKKMLDATALRHEAIASNIPNIETPNYKRVEVGTTFAAELKSALRSGNVDQMRSLSPQLIQDNSPSSRRDGNNVELEKELLAMNQNTLAHTLETQLVSGSLLKLRLAITGRTA